MIEDKDEYIEKEVVMDPDKIVKGCKADNFVIAEDNSEKGFWNFCPCCGTKLEFDKVANFYTEDEKSI